MQHLDFASLQTLCDDFIVAIHLRQQWYTRNCSFFLSVWLLHLHKSTRFSAIDWFLCRQRNCRNSISPGLNQILLLWSIFWLLVRKKQRSRKRLFHLIDCKYWFQNLLESLYVKYGLLPFFLIPCQWFLTNWELIVFFILKKKKLEIWKNSNKAF